MDEKLEKKVSDLKKAGKEPEQITYGMICDGFRSQSGIPDDFQSAEDLDVRTKLWSEHQRARRADYDWRDDREYSPWE